MMTEEQLNALVIERNTLGTECDRLQSELSKANARFRHIDLQLQAFCNHTFDGVIKGYEHEAPYCKRCGLNAQGVERAREVWNKINPSNPAPSRTETQKVKGL